MRRFATVPHVAAGCRPHAAVFLIMQLIKLYRTKSAADLSYWYLALYSIGLLFITVYVSRGGRQAQP
jgi:uncharacterized protein with PQ loop repeat